MLVQFEKILETAWAKTLCTVPTAPPAPNGKSSIFLNPTNLSTLSPGQEINLNITSLAHGGSGVGRHEDFVVFVPFTAPGDQAHVRILSLKKNYAEGQVLSILEKSRHRITPPCPVFGKCGGCQWQHVSYEEQLRQKQLIVEHALSRIAKEEGVKINPIVASPKEYHYRNRVQFRSDGPQVGFYQKQSHMVIEFEECLISEPAINRELKKIKEEVKSFPIGKIKKFEVALAENTGKDTDKNNNNVEKIIRTENRSHGEETGFSQVNTGQNTNLRNHLCTVLGTPQSVDRDNMGSAGNLLDLYCGNGNFSLPLNRQGWRIYGVDSSRSAISAARRSANENTFFSAADCSLEAKRLAQKKRRFEAVLLDPPRIGADERLWPNLVALDPATIVYVSCNPATFARDWARLKNKGPYRLEQITPFDMFPQTHHVELVALAHKSTVKG